MLMTDVPRLADLLAPDRVAVRVPTDTRQHAVDFAVGLLADCPAVVDPDRLAADVEAREALLSTGVGEGLALPHARTPAVTSTVATLCTLAAPVDWDAHDGEPVDLVLLFAGPEAARSSHVRLLAHLSRVLSAADVRRRIAEAGTPEELVAAVTAAEASA
jgi:PTS system fructose-specific IIA component